MKALAITGLAAALVAMLATALLAALAGAVGVDFEVPDGGEKIPVSGIAVVTGVFSLVGVVIALALVRWSARPAVWFLRTAITLTAISLVPPLLADADVTTTATLLGLHVLAAAVMIPALASALTVRTARAGDQGAAPSRPRAS